MEESEGNASRSCSCPSSWLVWPWVVVVVLQVAGTVAATHSVCQHLKQEGGGPFFAGHVAGGEVVRTGTVYTHHRKYSMVKSFSNY